MSDNGMMAEPDSFTEADHEALCDPHYREKARTIEQVTEVDDGYVVQSHERREVFTFDAPGIGTWRFDVRGIKDAIRLHRIPAWMMRLPEVPESFYQHVLNNNGVELQRLPKVTEHDLTRPGIMVHWPNGYSTLIDGNHRLCARYRRDMKDFRFLIVDVADCAPFMCRPGEEDKLFDRLDGERLHSEIQIEE
jgi:hypothetical protein